MLLYKADNIGQIVAAPEKYYPIEVIGVDQLDNRIYGYYLSRGEWKRKRTEWGDAKDGSMSSTDNEVIGLSKNDEVKMIFDVTFFMFMEYI